MPRIAGLVIIASLLPSGLMAQAVPADSANILGNWRLTLFAPNEIDFAIFQIGEGQGGLGGPVSSFYQPIGPLNAAMATVEDRRVTIKLDGPEGAASFQGTLEQDQKSAKGSIKFRGSTYPGRIEKTEAKAVAPPQKPAIAEKLDEAQAIKDPKARVARLLELIGQNAGQPITSIAYGQVIGLAEAAGLSAEEVGKLVGRWFEESSPYGPEWSAEVRSGALRGLQGMKTYASLATKLAQDAEKALPADASTERRASVATMLATSARLAGQAEVASEAEGRAKGFDDKLDAEYHEKVPPFKPATYAGRPEGKGSRVVVVEIFTGAECPPCVAADVAFDALLKTYKPSEVIGLQYHLHIPGPDPLTNADTVERMGYYASEVRGTPSTFFNGQSLPGGGGPMARSEAKYKEYRRAIDPKLDSEKRADIKLTATRSGDEVKVSASATAPAADKDAKPRLRLVLVEDSVRYPGGNKLRFHENVVRAFPGGVEGKPLDRGEGTVEATVRLDDLRKAQAYYLAQYPSSPRGRAFPRPVPTVELHDLSVVALVQDDADHAIWHAVQVPVKSGTP